MSVYSDDLEFPAVGALSGTLDFNTPSIDDDASLSVGILPGGALVTDAFLTVTTPFNASGTNDIHIGTEADKDFFVHAYSDGDLPAQAWRSVSSGVGYVAPRGGVKVYMQYEQTGDAATTGCAHFAVTFVPAKTRFR